MFLAALSLAWANVHAQAPSRSDCERACSSRNEQVGEFRTEGRNARCICECKPGWARPNTGAACEREPMNDAVAGGQAQLTVLRREWRSRWMALRQSTPTTCQACGDWAVRNLTAGVDKKKVPMFVRDYIIGACALFDECVVSLPPPERAGNCLATCGRNVCDDALRRSALLTYSSDETLRPVLEMTVVLNKPSTCR